MQQLRVGFLGAGTVASGALQELDARNYQLDNSTEVTNGVKLEKRYLHPRLARVDAPEYRYAHIGWVFFPVLERQQTF